MKKLVIAEKHTVGKAIADVVGAKSVNKGYIEGDSYIVTWCQGHLLENAKPESYGDKYIGPWRLDNLPIVPDPWKLSVIDESKAQLQIIKKLSERDDVVSLVEATDAGREGELIFRLVYRFIGCKKPFERLWVSSLEKSAIKKGFENLRSSEDFNDLYTAALSRSRADWLFGINGTRFYTVVSPDHKLRSVGRVQTPTLAMVVQRQREIENFVVTKRWAIVKDFGSWKLETEKFEDQRKANECLKKTQGKDVLITKIEKKNKKVKPPLLYSLTTLQQDANRRFGFTAKTTLEIKEKLYLAGVLSYPRSDSNYITDDDAPMMTRVVENLGSFFGKYVPGWENQGVKRLINNKGVNDHYAIIVTESFSKNPDTSKYSEDEKNIIRLVEARILESVAPWYEYEETKVNGECEGYEFTGIGNKILCKGWKDVTPKLFNRKEKAIGELPGNLEEGQSYTPEKTTVESRDTVPPRPYTEDTLLGDMEHAGAKEMDNDVERKGLGTSATRHETIEKLIKCQYIERNGKNLIATKRGKDLIDTVDDGFKNVSTTVEWENRLLRMQQGKGESLKDFCSSIEAEIIKLLKTSPLKENADGVEVCKCPICGGSLKTSYGNLKCDKCNRMLYRTSGFFDYKLTDDDVKKLASGGEIHASFLSKKPGAKPYKTKVSINIERTKADGKYFSIGMKEKPGASMTPPPVPS